MKIKPFFTKAGHAVFQGAVWLSATGVELTNYVPAKYKPIVIGASAAASLFVAWVHRNHLGIGDDSGSGNK